MSSDSPRTARRHLLTAGVAFALALSALAGGTLAATGGAEAAGSQQVMKQRWTAPKTPSDLVKTPAPASCKTATRPGHMSCFAVLGRKVSDPAAATAARADFAAQRTAVTSAAVTPMATLSKSDSYTPEDLASLYGIPADARQGDPTSATAPIVGIVDAGYDPNVVPELGFYRDYFGLPACTTGNGCFRIVDQSGAPVVPTSSQLSYGADWHGEIALDVEAVSAICPGCRILLVAANSDLASDLDAGVGAATSLGAQYVSMSYGSVETLGDRSLDSTFTGTAVDGGPQVTYVAATGDDGYSGVEWPASARGVIAAGGTSSTLVSGRWQQSAWDGTGSGCSRFEPQTDKQSAVASLTGVCSMRATADVSALADVDTGIMFYLAGGVDDTGQPDDGWWLGGGTSLAAPIITALYALAGNHTDPTSVYDNDAADPGAFADVTSGSTLSCTSAAGALCNAGVGWDGPTGLGAPVALAAFAAPGSTPIPAPTPSPTTPPAPTPTVTGSTGIRGAVRAGRTVTATMPTFKDLPRNARRAIRWYVNGRVVGHAATLELRRAWARRTLQVRVAETWTATSHGSLVTQSLSRTSRSIRIHP